VKTVKLLRAAAVAAGLAAGALFAPPAAACPSCAQSASPKEPNVWPVVGVFMLVPWAIAAGAVIAIRRNSRSA
jgi:hypothetical protein